MSDASIPKRGAGARKDRAEKIALFRYQLIREAADESVTCRQRGPMVRALAVLEHRGPFGEPVHVSKDTIDRWIRAWRRGGFDGLKPQDRAQGPATPPQILALAATLKRERPMRTAAQIRRIMAETLGDAPSESTLLRHFRSLDIPAGSPGQSRLRRAWVQQAGRGQRQGRDVVAEGPEQVPLDRREGASCEADRVVGGAQFAAYEGQVVGFDGESAATTWAAAALSPVSSTGVNPRLRSCWMACAEPSHPTATAVAALAPGPRRVHSGALPGT